MSKEPAGRYRTAGQLAAILRSYKEQSQQETGPITAAGLAAAVGVSAVDDLPIALTPEVPAENRDRSPVSERQTAVMDRPVVRSTRQRAEAEMVVEPVPPEPAGETPLLHLAVKHVIPPHV